jgi:Tol biopolymer transport system component
MLNAGTHLGPYEVLSHIGSGGMGEVYRARDGRLGRLVAVKVLPASLADDPDRARRFEQEARAASALAHPNILTVFDVGTSDGAPYLVTELLEGETLRQRLAAGALDARRAIGYAVQIADGLAAAHAKGIVHRDLKPENLFVTGEGQVKILDFGLARPPAPDLLSQAQTEERLTMPGIVLGTLPYLSPEQTRGGAVDARSDIWAFGVVVFELLAGHRPFQADTAAGTIGAILGARPDWSLLPGSTPPEVRALLERCLEKAPEARPRSIADVAVVLRDLASSGRAGRPRLFLPIVLGLTAAALAIVAWRLFLRPPGEGDGPFSVRPLVSLAGTEWTASWSPDGTELAFSRTDFGNSRIAVVSPGGEPRLVTKSPYDDQMPRWSPDGSKIAFVSDRGAGLDLYWVSPTGGLERKIAETGVSYLEDWTSIYSLGSSPWSPDARLILFSRAGPGGNRAVWLLDLDSGKERQVSQPPTGANDLEASFSFDGRLIAFARYESSRAALWTVRPDGTGARVLLEDAHANRGPAFTPGGETILFYSNRAGRWNIWAVSASGGRLRPITSGAGPDYLPVVSRRGQVLYSNWGHQTDLYLARVGEPDAAHERLTFNTSENYGGRISPDGKTLAYYSDRTGNYEIWLHDLQDGRERAATDGPADNLMPDWSPDGRALVFFSNRGGVVQIWTTKLEGAAAARLLTPQDLRTPADFAEGVTLGGPRWSPDGTLIGYVAPSDHGQTLWVVGPDGAKRRSTSLRGVSRFDWYLDDHRVVYVRSARDGGTPGLFVADLESGREQLLLEGPCGEVAVSADGRWVAYVQALSHFGMNLFRLPLSPPSTDDGLPQAAGPALPVTKGAGLWHVHGGAWSRDGKKMVYVRDTDRADIYVIDGFGPDRSSLISQRPSAPKGLPPG